MSITFIVSLKVEDFDKWLAVFSSMNSKREEADIQAKGHQNIDDPNNAVVIGTAPSKEKFLEMFATPERQKRQKTTGVLGREVTFLEEA